MKSGRGGGMGTPEKTGRNGAISRGLAITKILEKNNIQETSLWHILFNHAESHLIPTRFLN